MNKPNLIEVQLIELIKKWEADIIVTNNSFGNKLYQHATKTVLRQCITDANKILPQK